MPEPRDLPRYLSEGTHLIPEDGACLMELVSVVAGEPWTDTPKSTHPVLTHLAQLVNDAMTDAGRQSLRPLARRLARLAGDDPRLAPVIAAACTRYALDVAPTLRVQAHNWYARRQFHRAAARADICQRLADRLYARGPARRAIEAAFASVLRAPATRDHSDKRDEALRALLATGVQASEHLTPATMFVT